MSVIPKVFKRTNRRIRQLDRQAERSKLRSQLRAKIQWNQERLDTEDFEGREDEAVRLTQANQRMAAILSKIEVANAQG